MRRVVITGIGSVTAAGIGVDSLQDAFTKGTPLGSDEQIDTLRGRKHTTRVSRIDSFDREAFLSSRRLRRMSEASQIWVITCLLASTDAGLGDPDAGHRPHPEKCGNLAGTGFGSTDVTWDYLQGMLEDGPGMANPFLFSESVANAPAGHAGIDLDLRGTNVTVTCADASASSALDLGIRAIRTGRLDAAWCGGFEVLSDPLLRVLATLDSLGEQTRPLHIGEGGICFVLESLENATRRGARIYAEVTGTGLASDPMAGATQWSRAVEPHRRAIQKALEQAGGVQETPVNLTTVEGSYHLAGSTAETAVLPIQQTPEVKTTGSIAGIFSAAGGADLAAAVLAAGESTNTGNHCMSIASSWGGTIVTHVLRSSLG